jgi:hypothetical protein
MSSAPERDITAKRRASFEGDWPPAQLDIPNLELRC